jgi:hypothetical protein
VEAGELPNREDDQEDRQQDTHTQRVPSAGCGQ